MAAHEPLIELIFERLAADDIPTSTAEVVLAALTGEDDLEAVLAGRTPTLDPGCSSRGDQPHRGIYLSAVTVAGFRGIGAQRTLSLHPGPGLTVVAGRNGSGKSSFAEAVELSLTGDSTRWADKNSVWRTGWRNLHTPHPCAITTELRIDGMAAPTRVSRTWPADADLSDARVSVSTPDGSFTDLTGLGLGRATELYRPFLTAAELSTLLTGTNSQLFDAIHAILGLDALTAADKRLMSAMRPHETAIKQLRAQHEVLLATLEQLPDERAYRAVTLLRARRPDLDQLDAILAEPRPQHADANLAAGRALAELGVPDPAEIQRLAQDLHEAARDNQRHDHARTGASIRVAELLRLALDHHDAHGDTACPVCHTGTLDTIWRSGAVRTLEDLRVSTLAARRTSARVAELVGRARTVVTGIVVPDGALPGVPLDDLRQALAALRETPEGPDALAGHLDRAYPDVATAAALARTGAAAWLRQQDDVWQHTTDSIRLWVAAARQASGHERALTLLKDARAWLKSSGEQIRNQRLAPFAAASQRIWRELRQESNVELGPMSLTGTNTRRRVVFPVSVDGADNGTALGVMSQGEMHALALATFLPRSCAAESPFQFTVIDDPVQSMDPAKVDGLARVLAALAEHRQVVVFTHDSRLPDALRRLDLDAQEIEVVRAERSIVTLRPAADPVSRYLDDANALALSREIAEEVRAPVVAEMCRSALEAACHRIVWRTRLARGTPHADIEKLLDTATKLSITMALALFDDPGRGGDVLTRLNNRYGGWAGDAYQACRRGVHGGYIGDLPRLVRDVRRLAGALS